MPATGPAPLVIKIGGGDELDLPELCGQVARLRNDHPVVIVHGGGRALSAELERSGARTRFVDGLRFTDDRVLEAAIKIFCGTVGKEIVGALARSGVTAAGISGIDGGLVRVTPEASGRLGRVGQVESVDSALLHALLAAGISPVVAPLGTDGKQLVYNVNADSVAGAVARALGAWALVFVSNVPGVLDRDGRTVDLVTPQIANELKRSGAVDGGMIPKLESALDLLDHVGSVHIVDGGRGGSIERALSGGRGGTRFAASSS
jgi:acetylglutamate kinase